MRSMPSFPHSSATTSAVMPARAPVEVGGVKISPFLTMKMFSPTPSAMQPLAFKADGFVHAVCVGFNFCQHAV